MTRGGDETGGIALLVVLGSVLLLGAALVVLTAVTDLQVAAARARTAADAAALAGAGASPLVGGDGDTCGLARRVATANDGRLVACRAAGAPGTWTTPMPAVEVEVAVQPQLDLVRRAAGDVRARAAATVRPRVSAPVPSAPP